MARVPWSQHHKHAHCYLRVMIRDRFFERPAQVLEETNIFRISRAGFEKIIDVAWVDEIEPAIRAKPPGRYDIDKTEPKPFSSSHASRPWGIAVRRQDPAAGSLTHLAALS